MAEKIKELNSDKNIKTSVIYETRQDKLNELFDHYKQDNYNIIKIDETFITFIRTLILNDLIDEEYSQYISKNYGDTPNENDKQFIRNVHAKKENDFNFKLFDIDMIYEKVLKDKLYNATYTFNFDIILFLSKKNLSDLNNLLEQNNKKIDLLYANFAYNYEKIIKVDGLEKYVQKNIKEFVKILVDKQISTIQTQDFYALINNNIQDEGLLLQYYKLNLVKIENYKVIKNNKEVICILSKNIEKAFALLEDDKVVKDCKFDILKALDIESIKNNILRTFQIIEKFNLYDSSLLSTQIYEILLKNLGIQEDKDALLKNILGLLSNESEYKRILRTYDIKFNSTKKNIILDKTDLNLEILNKVEKFNLYEIIEEDDKFILSKKNNKTAV